MVERLSLYLVSNIAAGKTEVHHQLSFLCAAWSKLTSPLVATPAARSEIALVSCTKGLCVSLGIYFDVYHQIWSQQAPDQQEESAIRELSSVVHPSEIVTAVKAIISFASGELAAVKQAAQLSLEIRLGVVNTVARAIACRPSLQRALSMTTRATEFCRRSFLQVRNVLLHQLYSELVKGTRVSCCSLCLHFWGSEHTLMDVFFAQHCSNLIGCYSNSSLQHQILQYP